MVNFRYVANFRFLILHHCNTDITVVVVIGSKMVRYRYAFANFNNRDSVFIYDFFF